MAKFKRKIIAKISVLFLIVSVFYSFVLSGGDLFALGLSIQNDASNEAFSFSGAERKDVCISNNYKVFDSFKSVAFDRENFIVKPKFSKKSFLSFDFNKYFLHEHFYARICDPLLVIFLQCSVSRYLLYQNIRV